MSAEENHDSLPRDENPSNNEPEQKAQDSQAPDLKATSTSDSAETGVPEPVEVAAPPAPSVQGSVLERQGRVESQAQAPAPTPVEGEPKTFKEVSPSPPENTRAGPRRRWFAERSPEIVEVPPEVLRRWTRRDLLLFGAGAVAALGGTAFLLPQNTLARMGVNLSLDSPGKEWLVDRALRVDDDVAEALYSKDRLVPTYTKSQITPLKNNYNGVTPDPAYIPGWRLTLEGLASGLSVSLDLRNLLTRFALQEQITRLVCVEGWSAVAWWSGLRFDDLLHAYPPMSQAQWARIDSAVNLDPQGNPDPYYVSLDLRTARHPQTLLATHFNGQPLTVEHGAPLRLVAPVKLGLKNIKAITRIAYVAEEPQDYWAERGYSRYDGI